jgi:amino acid transporter
LCGTNPNARIPLFFILIPRHSSFRISFAGLFPSSLAKTFGPNHTPTNALLVGSVIGYSFALVVCFFPGLEGTIFNVCAISAFSAYISQFIGFIVFRKEFADHKRGFHNPFGLQQAVLGMLLSLVGVISIIGFQNDPYHTAVVIFVLAILIMVAYYFAYAKARQSFSPEEQVIFRKQIALCK